MIFIINRWFDSEDRGDIFVVLESPAMLLNPASVIEDLKRDVEQEWQDAPYDDSVDAPLEEDDLPPILNKAIDGLLAEGWVKRDWNETRIVT